MKKKVYLLLFLAVNISVSAQKENTYYKEIDVKLANKQFTDFKIDIPENWFSYNTDPGMMAHSPNEFKGRVSPNDLAVSFIVHKKNIKRKNLEKSLKNFLGFQKQFYDKFNYELFEGNHKKYGKYYIVKYAQDTKGGKEIVLLSIFNWKKHIYHLYYSSDEFNYDKYLIAATRMINSFEIKE